MFDATPLLRAYARLRSNQLRRLDPAECQQAELRKLIQRAAVTNFGKEHSFSTIENVKQYQQKVPLRKYEDFWKCYWEPAFPQISNVSWPGNVPYFAVSSGTSAGTTKYIPCTREMIRSNNRAGTDLLIHHLNASPQSKLFAGKNFMLGGSTALVERAPGVFSGDLSGISVKELPFWARARYFPPRELALLSNWEEKIEALARAVLKEDIRLISGVPSWMLIFFDKLAELAGHDRPIIKKLLPNLEVLVHGGVNFAPYHDQFLKLLEGSRAETREVYPASEGFIASADRGFGEGLRLNLDNGIFYEFVPLEELDTSNPTRHWIANAEPDVNYAIVLSNCSGMWSYILGDTVRFVDTKTPRVLVTGRISYYLSAFGEHLIAEEIEDAISSACHELQIHVVDYSVGAVFPADHSQLGGHLYVIEFNQEGLTDQIREQMSNLIDQRLCKRNEDYEAHRAEGFGLMPPQIMVMPHGGFAEWMKSRGKLGGQNKVPRIISSPELFDNLVNFCERLSQSSHKS